ncbi:helix-turn-helix transcriptional regulator|uniref:Helix-turn-helix n=1 Tax=Dendrosporobacter quercicolus TaxID=146817 RepID=A0A1G9TX12_9FIRM|nr:helix-turn-helix transcriptional regulator [Dendrosporobacter quercicolus]NSL48825.1 helix-turn-helix transcriptional regulator [Dendrosporobacter quercicolus DSM 1736]SDM52128.1 Helix-turn-helix [Dendrosporobacter quercicolus]
MDISQIIRSNREKQNMSINLLAKKAGISQSSLSRIEAGINSPTFEVLERIVTALGLSLSNFFSSVQPELEPDLKRLLDTIKALTTAQRQALQVFLECMKN